MAINVVARKLLWGRAGNRCAWQGCGQRLTVATGDDEAGVLVTQGIVLGHEAHIRSSRPGGPRHDPMYPVTLLDTYENLVLLCPSHHSAIDKDYGVGWPVGVVVKMKTDHEQRIDQALSSSDRRRQQLELAVATQLTVWEKKLGIDDSNEWQNLTFGLNLPVPAITCERLARLHSLSEWLLARTWPSELRRLRAAFDRHFSIIQMLVWYLCEVTDSNGELIRRMARPYKRLDRWDPPEYERLLRQTNIQIAIVWYLALELARSTNLVITAARLDLDPMPLSLCVWAGQ